MKNNKKIILFFLIISLGSFFCGKDFLNPTVPGNILRQQYVTDLNTTQEFLHGLYNNATPILAGNTIVYPEIIADNIKSVTGGVLFAKHYEWSQQASNSASNDQNLNLFSANIYNIISGCNFVIENAEKYRSEDEIKASSIKGQALTMRAIMHFLLVNHFAHSFGYTADASHTGIALNTTSDWKTPPKRRNSVLEVYNLIETDLKQAIQLLPTSRESSFLLNQYGAKCMLARVLLFKGDFAGARIFAREVSNAVPIMTENYPEKLYTLQETEAIFQVDQNLLTPVILASQYFRAVVQFTATSDIVNLLNESSTDLRRAWVTKGGSPTNVRWLITKYPQGIIPAVTNANISYYHTVFRASEMYLTAAESYANMGAGYEDSARFFLNKIRKRADPLAADVVATGGSLLDSIYKERRKELAFEGLRMFDLLRWKAGVNRVDVLDPLHSKLPYGSDMEIAPIPDQDVKLLGYNQNLGY